jgi:hypothetical protein
VDTSGPHDGVVPIRARIEQPGDASNPLWEVVDQVGCLGLQVPRLGPPRTIRLTGPRRVGKSQAQRFAHRRRGGESVGRRRHDVRPSFLPWRLEEHRRDRLVVVHPTPPPRRLLKEMARHGAGHWPVSVQVNHVHGMPRGAACT